MDRIKAAAIKDHDGTVYQLPPPARHHNVIRLMVEAGRPKPITGEQGFVLEDDRFVDRVTAKQIAVAANQQIPRAMNLRELFSEDVW